MGSLASREVGGRTSYDHWRTWSADGSLEKVWQASLGHIKAELDLRQMNLDGSHAIAKKGVPRVAYQARKRAKTSNILPITDGNGYVVACTGIIAGNHNDAFKLKAHLQHAFKSMKQLGLVIADALFDADSAFDTKEASKVCFNHQVVPWRKTNATENPSSVDVSDYLTLRSTKRVLSVSARLLGLIRFVPYWFVLTARTLIFWQGIISPLH